LKAAAQIGGALALAQRLGVARLDAQWLLCHLLQRPRAWLLAHDQQVLPEPLAALFESGVQRRLAGEPLAYITGWVEFCGLALQVTPAVLIPRPETEGLVQWGLACLQQSGLQQPASPSPPLRVLDLGTGSGAIALALQQGCQQAGLVVQVLATDASPSALAVAQANAERLGSGQAPGPALDWSCGSWWQAVPAAAQFDLVVSNPPYIARGDVHLQALQYEPQAALTAGPQGLDDLRQIIAGALAYLLPGGWLLLEHGHDQDHAVRELMAQHGLIALCTQPDLAQMPRLTGGRRPTLAELAAVGEIVSK
jgi:release factor glutamine methyltransferase